MTDLMAVDEERDENKSVRNTGKKLPVNVNVAITVSIFFCSLSS